MLRSMKLNLAVTMFGVDPSCLGGISTLARMLCEELPKSSGVDFEYISTVNQGSGWEKVRVFQRALTLANRRFSQVRGVVHIHMADNASIFRSAVVSGIAKRNGQTVVLQIHCDLYRIRNASTAAMQKLIDGVIRRADYIITLGSYLTPLFELLSYPLSQVTALSNPVPCPDNNGYSTSRSKILFLGNVSKDKGVPELLEAVAQIDSTLDSEIQIEICGKDHMNVKEAIERRGLERRVIYRGVVAPDQTFFSQYLLNILPSHKEAMPFALLEASANGVPSIATRVGSIPEIIEDGVSGFLVEPNDSFALAQRIVLAVRDRDRLMQMSNEIYSVIRAQYAVEPYMEKLLAIYNELSA